MRLALCSDHADFEFKTSIIEHLKGYEIKDFGPFTSTLSDCENLIRLVANVLASVEVALGI